MSGEEATLVLPLTIATVSDLRRVVRELEEVDSYLVQANIKAQKSSPMPKLSSQLEELARVNDVQLLDQTIRQTFTKRCSQLEKQAVVVHMSFNSQASPAFLKKIVSWWRKNVAPNVLLQVGLQPGLAAGSVVRTPNHSFDFSLRTNLLKQREQLLAVIAGKDK